VEDRCAICGCKLKKQGVYGEDTQRGRSHPTKHHYVAERFFGRSANRKHKKRTPIFDDCPLNFQGKPKYFCYDCHEELLHNPVLLPADIEGFAKLVKLRNLAEVQKASRKDKLACRIMLLHEVIETGIGKLLEKERRRRSMGGA